MSIPLNLLLGGVLFLLVYSFAGIEWVIPLALALLILELRHDLALHRKPT